MVIGLAAHLAREFRKNLLTDLPRRLRTERMHLRAGGQHRFIERLGARVVLVGAYGDEGMMLRGWIGGGHVGLS